MEGLTSWLDLRCKARYSPDIQGLLQMAERDERHRSLSLK